MLSVEYFTHSDIHIATRNLSDYLERNKDYFTVSGITVHPEEPFGWVVTLFYERSTRKGITYNYGSGGYKAKRG